MSATVSDITKQAFWARVDKRGADDCWLWTGVRTTRGYGRIFVAGTGRRAMATRISWQIANGADWPDGLLALHRCDNPPCVNPNHLFLGTHADNRADCIEKGRAVLGPSRRDADTYGHGKLCRNCGHHRTDDYRDANGWKCRPCNHARAVRNTRLRAERTRSTSSERNA